MRRLSLVLVFVLLTGLTIALAPPTNEDRIKAGQTRVKLVGEDFQRFFVNKPNTFSEEEWSEIILRLNIAARGVMYAEILQISCLSLKDASYCEEARDTLDKFDVEIKRLEKYIIRMVQIDVGINQKDPGVSDGR